MGRGEGLLKQVIIGMTERPLRAACVLAGSNALLLDALRQMQRRASQISVLPVIDGGTGLCAGLLRLHDISRTALG